MSSKAIKERREDRPLPEHWQPTRETAPSVVRQEEPTMARIIGMIGLMLVVLGVAALLLHSRGWRGLIGPTMASSALVAGILGLLLHAISDRDQQIRRLYGLVGFLWLAVGAVLPFLPVRGGVGSLFGPGIVSGGVALLFLLAFLRNETEVNVRELTLKIIGGVGAALALVGLVGSFIRAEFLLPYGLLSALLGLAYLWAFVGSRGISDDFAYWGCLLVGLFGLGVFLVALGLSALPPLIYSWGWLSAPPAPYLVPTGLVLMSLGLLYALFAVLMLSDHPLVVVYRRELASFFYSPIAHIVLFFLTLLAWWYFWDFLNNILEPLGPPMIEPIVQGYFIRWWAVIYMIVAVPMLTMRLLSEEKRSGTLEVLLTAPVKETSVVFGKFLAALTFFILIWVPWVLFLVGLRIEGGQPFDYRPLFSFFIALIVTGSAFVSMGLFFSSLSGNQIISFVLTAAGMLILTGIFFVKQGLLRQSPEGGLVTVLEHASYIDLWINTLEGALVLKYLLFPLSLTVMFIFLTVKVLEARRWA